MTTAERERQQVDALARANEIRLQNSRAKQYISSLSYADGCEYVAGILENPTEPVGSIRICQLLLSIDRIGDRGVVRYLRYAEVRNSQQRVRHLTTRQRESLAYALRNRWVLHP